MTESMAQAEGSVPSGLLPMLTRMGERVASQEAKHEALKADTEQIRVTIHAINNELQKMVIASDGYRRDMQNLTSQVAMLVQAAPAITAAVSTFEGMRGDIKHLLDQRQQTAGRLTLVQTIAAFLRGVLPWLVAVIGVGMWALQNLRIR